MNIRKLFDEIRSADLFNAFWEYPEEKNLSVLASRLPHIKSPKELRCAIAQICNYVFEENEEGSFLYTEAQNLLKHAEVSVERAAAMANVTSAYADIISIKEEKDKNKFVMWENAVINKLCQLYKESLISFCKDLSVYEIEEHIKIVLFGESQSVISSPEQNAN
ncbi:uncharacterized protein NESG_01055 [Nematocida ausubeli]|uniref:Uncharacterized protein n=1 Tax=Nematocida ausubeli (strain ATCC PRA-371 / ERTm2) TaxID=1913371 RepID=A0A086J431_NEMA1|nr:uncharacterized protein NESG_01055 [Nematocida ausubeli]KAI5132329.1 hypothetical protein NEAUS07_0091 [Nematocida ausubeli]KAI5147015.1 hypothetical protein NEAUS05_0347 [Nematocida ausubeli]KFG26899.1 hypothetical protein NESG_01055 [Nematocida ausubeli]